MFTGCKFSDHETDKKNEKIFLLVLIFLQTPVIYKWYFFRTLFRKRVVEKYDLVKKELYFSMVKQTGKREGV